eukprot:3390286-Alexandrium_andersonii.AAC.1
MLPTGIAPMGAKPPSAGSSWAAAPTKRRPRGPNSGGMCSAPYECEHRRGSLRHALRSNGRCVFSSVTTLP